LNSSQKRKLIDIVNKTKIKYGKDFLIRKGAVMTRRKPIEFRHDRLLTLVEANHWNVQQLAEKVGVTRQLVYRWLNGQSIPGIKALIRLCDLFKVDINFFFPSMRKTKLEAVLV